MHFSNRIKACLGWIETATWPNGGVAAWVSRPLQVKGPLYPEVTGYLISTLLHWDKAALAKQYADWLVVVQNPEGYWLGIDKKPHCFDTAMCLDGLRYFAGKKRINQAIERAEDWLLAQIDGDGTMHRGPGTEFAPFYAVLACAVIGVAPHYWINKLRDDEWPWTNPERMHYILYGLAGMQEFGEDEARWLKQIRSLPQPLKFWYGKNWATHMLDPRIDLCANAQATILLKDRSYLAVVEAEQQPDGGILEHPGATRCTSWTAKYYLDAMYLCTKGKM